MKKLIRRENPDKADALLSEVYPVSNTLGVLSRAASGATPSGFSSVETTIEPDFRLIAAISNAQHCFTLSDPSQPDNPITYASPSFLRLTGYDLREVLGRNCRFLQGPETSAEAIRLCRDAALKGEDVSICFLNYRKDGSSFWNQTFISPLKDNRGTVVSFVGVMCEVSLE